MNKEEREQFLKLAYKWDMIDFWEVADDEHPSLVYDCCSTELMDLINKLEYNE